MAAALTCVAPSTARSQPPAADPSTLTIEQLLEVKLTSTASKFAQEITRAPASVTVVTAVEIRQYGYRTLAEILSHVRGFYTTYDRNYTYVGVRGFARPGDYNTRVLLLVDGHRLNEPIYDMASIGTDFPIDAALIERVEVIRGPGSSLYGTSAFFAIVNVITRSGGSSPGIRLDASGGSLGTGGVNGALGHVFEGGNEMLLAASGYRSSGNARLYYPEFDVAGVSDGVATDADGDASAAVHASASLGRLRISGAFNDRTKQVPTASFQTVFGDRRTQTEDRRGFASAAYTGPFFGDWTGVARTGLDFTSYTGTYPYDQDGATVVQSDRSHSLQASGELTLNRRTGRHVFTLGSEIRRSLHNHQFTSDNYGVPLDENHPTSTLGLYAQDEVTLRPWLLLNAGVRLDYNGAFGANLAPRAGLVFLPRRNSSVKILYGRAFRAPNSYELHYFAAMRERGFTLEPETIATTEVVWEGTIGSHLRAAASAFRYHADQLVEQRVLAVALMSATNDGGLYFVNAGRTTANGADGELEACWANGIGASLNYGFVRATDLTRGGRLSNSPRHMTNARVTAPLRPIGSTLALEARGVSERVNVNGETVPGFVIGNVTLTKVLSRRLDLGVSFHNVLDARYADPGADEHVQQAILQDGRTVRVRLTAKF